MIVPLSTSFNGRTSPFDGGDFGSNPRVLANEQRR